MIKQYTFITVLFLSIIFNGCKQDDKNEYTIGAVLPLTGSLSYLGEPEKNALLLALEDANKILGTKGKKINLIIGDSKGESKEGVNLANKFISIDKVKTLIVSTSGISKSVVPVSNGVVTFTQCMDPDVTSMGEHVFRLLVNYRTEQKLIADYALKKGYKNIAIFRTNAQGMQIESDEFKNFAKTNNLNIVIEETFEQKDSDFRVGLKKIVDKNPDCVLLLGYGNYYYTIVKQLKQYNSSIPILGNISFTIESALIEGTSVYDGVVFATFAKNLDDPEIRAFTERYHRAFNQNLSGFIDYLYFYDLLMILSDIYLKNDKMDYELISTSLKNMNNYKGLTGIINYMGKRDSDLPMKLAVYKNNKLEFIE